MAVFNVALNYQSMQCLSRIGHGEQDGQDRVQGDAPSATSLGVFPCGRICSYQCGGIGGTNGTNGTNEALYTSCMAAIYLERAYHMFDGFLDRLLAFRRKSFLEFIFRGKGQPRPMADFII